MQRLALAVALCLTTSLAHATTVSWADWTSSTDTTATGSITVGPNSTGVTFDAGRSGFDFVQTNNTGTYYWTQGTPAPYTGGSVSNAPATSDIIALGNGGPRTITFSNAVTDPYFALVSWNGNTPTFSSPMTLISEGCGYWGCGTFDISTDHLSFTGNGEAHGIIEFVGTFKSISFTDTSETWHGLTVGIAGIAPPSVPEPATLAILGTGLLGLGLLRRKSA